MRYVEAIAAVAALAGLMLAGSSGTRGARQGAMERTWPTYKTNPFVFKTQQVRAGERRGGITVADLNREGLMDFIHTAPGMIGAYDHWGKKLWALNTSIRLSGQSESEGLPGLHHPGVQVADVDGDGKPEAVFLLEDGSVVVADGRTGHTEMIAKPPVFGEVQKWESFIICNLRGKGDRDIVLQATNPRGYRVGHYLQAHAVEALDSEPLWRREGFGALAHGPVRAADLDGDGRDEIAGFTIARPDGSLPENWQYPPIGGGPSFHIDSVFIYDVRPDVPGLEVVLLEEGRNRVALVNLERGVLWHVHHRRQEPQNAAVGDFDPGRPGLEIWCRSRHDVNQTPWVLDAQGKVIAELKMAEVAPAGWTDHGVEEISVIDWDGSGPRYCAAKERHREGDVCIFDPMTGKFIKHWKETASRIYVADIAGDWREEIIVVSGDEVRVYWNDAPNSHPKRPRYWTQNHYRRSKANWNYYSP